jgi:hypothetical protein
MTGKEGSTLAGRYQDSQQTFLFMPFILDEGAGRVAVRVSTSEGTYFDTAAKTVLGWAVAAPGEPGPLADTTIVVFVNAVTASSEE